MNKVYSVQQMINTIVKSVEVRQAKFDHETKKPTGPMFTFLVGAGFSVTAGLPSVNHLVVSLEQFKKSKGKSWHQIFDESIEG